MTTRALFADSAAPDDSSRALPSRKMHDIVNFVNFTSLSAIFGSA
jgi:hypothetical protein